jgi:ATP-dependent Clp protease adaptor protein ClpS
MNKTIEKEKKKENILRDDSLAELIIFDDDFNTFNHVIACLKWFCGLSNSLAELYTLKIHSEGKCVILNDNKTILEPICENLIECGLSAEIHDIDDRE